MHAVSRARISLLCVALALLCLLSVVAAAPPREAEFKPTVILISLDGFRADYLVKFSAPNLKRLARAGVRARWMTPAFPALTFPNHYTIATGLHPQHHGIVGNDIYDPQLDASFSMNNKAAVQDGRWWWGEPIWITAEKQRQRAGVYFFPGSEAEIEGARPSFWKPYDGKVPNQERVDTVLSWLDLPSAERPTFIALYFSDVDTAGHDFSPDSKETGQAVARVDAAVGRLIEGLRKRNLYERVNLIIVSDHGMATIEPQQVVMLEDYFDTQATARVLWGAELMQIFPRPGREQAVYSALKSAPHVRCYLKQEIPARFHYREGRRIGPIICLADEGWRIYSRERYAEDQRKGKFPNHAIGAHGYDNRLPSMRATFIAHGPAFKRGLIVRPFQNVDVYNIMARILHLRPAKNDGNPRTARAVLR